MLLLVARGREILCRRSKLTRPGHSRYAHSKNAGPGTYARIRDFRPNGTSEQGSFPAQRRVLISRDSTITEGWADRARMEADREQPASEVLHPDAEGTKEA